MTSQSVPSHSPALPVTHTKGRDRTIRESKICLRPSQQKSWVWTQGLNAYNRMEDYCLNGGPESSRICCPLARWLEGLGTRNSILSTDSHRAYPHCVVAAHGPRNILGFLSFASHFHLQPCPSGSYLFSPDPWVFPLASVSLSISFSSAARPHCLF